MSERTSIVRTNEWKLRQSDQMYDSPAEYLFDCATKPIVNSEHRSGVNSAWIEHARVERIQDCRLGRTIHHLQILRSVSVFEIQGKSHIKRYKYLFNLRD